MLYNDKIFNLMNKKITLIVFVFFTCLILSVVSCGKQQTQRKLSGKWDLIKIDEYPNQEDTQWQFADPKLIIDAMDHGIHTVKEYTMQITNRNKFKIWPGNATDSTRSFGVTMVKKDILRIEEYEGKVVAVTREFVRANK